MKKFVSAIAMSFLLVIIYMAFKTLTFYSKQHDFESIEISPVSEKSLENFTNAIRLKTIVSDNPAFIDSASFRSFVNLIGQAYPLTDSLLEKRVFNEFGLLYKWPGKDHQLKPAIILAHYDVVPVDDMDAWEFPPFGGVVKNGKVWGRGSIDNKMNVIGILEAIEALLRSGLQAERTFYFCFGHDEEVGGNLGAKAMADYLMQQQVEGAFVIDEGYAITKKLVPGFSKEVAIIGIAEKGYASLKLSVKHEGGHSSIPNHETAIDIIGRALLKLKSHPFTSKISKPLQYFTEHIGPEMPLTYKTIFANANLLESFIIKIYESNPSSLALVRTTMVPTIFHSGTKDNVIPNFASATINLRILPGHTIGEIKNHILKTLNDRRIKLEILPSYNAPSPVSNIRSTGYKILNKTIKEIFPNAITAPNLVVGGTDSRHFVDISDNIYRFSPVYLDRKNINTIHGINESVTIKDLENSIQFYQQLIVNSNEKWQD